MQKHKLLLLSVSAGAGHMRAAEALRVQASMDSRVLATHLDVMDFVPATFRKIYTDFYIKLVNKAPTLWGYLYQLSNEAQNDSSIERLRRAIERLNTKALLREIESIQPSAIICTHFLPAELLSKLIEKSGLSCPVWVQVTDFDLHRLWVQRHIQGYFAANDEVAFRMRAQGIDAQRICVTGIPIMPSFGLNWSRQDCALELGLDPQRQSILLMGGGAGLGSLDSIAARLLALSDQFQLIVLAGKNRQVLAALEQLAQNYPGRLMAQGFTDKVEQLMACVDLVITKPGGLTTSECLAMGLPMIVNSPIPGQEERNADFLLEQGVALKAFDAVTLEYRVRFLLDNPDKLRDMSIKAKALGRANAAQQVLARVMAQGVVSDQEC